MTKQCMHCGQELPKDDARFCTRCGAPVSSDLLRSPLPPEKSVSAPVSRHPSQETSGEKAPLREQVAQQPGGRWSSIAPEQGAHLNISKREPSPSSLSSYPPVPPALKNQPAPEPRPPSQLPRTIAQPVSQIPAPAEKKGEQPAPVDPPALIAEKPAASEKRPIAIEDLPTAVMPSSPVSESGLIRQEAAIQHAEPARPPAEAGNATIEDLPTRSMPLTPAQRDVLSDTPGRKATPSSSNIDEIANIDTLVIPTGSAMDAPTRQAISSSRATDAQPQTPPARRRSMSVVLALLSTVALLAVVWIYVARPFSVADVTRPWQPFSDARMGVALNYPTGWPQGSYDKTGTLSLHDSSNTAMVTVAKASASGSDPAHLLQLQAGKLALTNVKALTALSFAGVNWQREQGSLQINGATYTVVLLTAAHGNTLYTLGLFAAQSVYPEYEQTIFAPMRASLHFL